MKDSGGLNSHSTLLLFVFGGNICAQIKNTALFDVVTNDGFKTDR